MMNNYDYDPKDFRNPKNANIMHGLIQASHQIEYPYMYTPRYFEQVKNSLVQYLDTCWETTYNVPTIDPPVVYQHPEVDPPVPMDTPRDYLI